jgi:hypothetical protein
MIAGITAILAMCLPILSILLAFPALAFGILSLRQVGRAKKPFAVTGIATASVALVASLGILLLGSGRFTGNTEAYAIEKVLQKSAGISRDAQRKFPKNHAAQARYFAIELQKVDTRSCPPEFRVAFQDNIEAWETAIPYLAANTPLTMFFEGFFGGLPMTTRGSASPTIRRSWPHRISEAPTSSSSESLQPTAQESPNSDRSHHVYPPLLLLQCSEPASRTLHHR